LLQHVVRTDPGAVIGEARVAFDEIAGGGVGVLVEKGVVGEGVVGEGGGGNAAKAAQRPPLADEIPGDAY